MACSRGIMPAMEWSDLLVVVVGVAVVLVLSGQCRKPSGWPGRFITGTMNRSHSGLTDWGLGHVALAPGTTVLDVGCGGGRTLGKLAAATGTGRVVGVDYSPTCVAASRRANSALVAAGRVDVQRAAVSQLPFADGTFDLVSAVETHYYWPRLVDDLREIRRVLKAGGRLLLIAETYRGRRFDAPYRTIMRLLRATYLTQEQHHELLVDAGFADVVVSVERGKGWICAVGRKPAT